MALRIQSTSKATENYRAALAKIQTESKISFENIDSIYAKPNNSISEYTAFHQSMTHCYNTQTNQSFFPYYRGFCL